MTFRSTAPAVCPPPKKMRRLVRGDAVGRGDLIAPIFSATEKKCGAKISSMPRRFSALYRSSRRRAKNHSRLRHFLARLCFVRRAAARAARTRRGLRPGRPDGLVQRGLSAIRTRARPAVAATRVLRVTRSRHSRRAERKTRSPEPIRPLNISRRQPCRRPGPARTSCAHRR